MSETSNPIQSTGSLPDNYQEVLYWRVTEKTSRVIMLQIFAGLLFVIFGFIFFKLAVIVGKLPEQSGFSLAKISSDISSNIVQEKLPSQGEYGVSMIEILSGIGFLLAGIVLTFVLHEFIHGLSMRIFGGKPKYGVIWSGMMFYATSPGYAFLRNNYLIIALAPLVLISILVVLGMWLLQGTTWVTLLGICGAINASGAIGDMWITRIVLRYPATALIIDERDGIRLFLPKS